jgi:hypothetical protein
MLPEQLQSTVLTFGRKQPALDIIPANAVNKIGSKIIKRFFYREQETKRVAVTAFEETPGL